MKILHTSDWHLGRTIEGRSRLEEQEAFLAYLNQLANEEGIDLILVAGDVYDTPNPPSKAEELFYRSLKQLAAGGKRPIIVIAGNHDSPDRLAAALPIAQENGILIAGRHRDQVRGVLLGEGAVLDQGEGFLVLEMETTAGIREKAVITYLPFPSEQRLGELFVSRQDNEVEAALSYSDKVGQVLKELAQRFREDSVNVLVSHLYVSGGISTDSERPIQIGGGYTVEADHLPSEAHYIALGHLHRPQTAGSERAYYSGSPLQYSRSEIGYSKAVMVIEAEAGDPQQTQIRKIEVPLIKPLEVWRANSVEAAIELCKTNRDRTVWAYMELDMPSYPDRAEVRKILEAKPDLLAVIPLAEHVYTGLEADAYFDKPMDELFALYYSSVYGKDPSSELLKVFGEIASQDERDEGGEADATDAAGN